MPIELVDELPGARKRDQSDLFEVADEMKMLTENPSQWGKIINFEDEYREAGLLDDPDERRKARGRVTSRLGSQKETLEKYLSEMGYDHFTISQRSGALYAQWTPPNQEREAEGVEPEALDGGQDSNGGGSSERADAAAENLSRLR